MRKVRDYDAELKALNERARELKARKVQYLGELVMATGADTLDLHVLTGGLLQVVEEAKATGNREVWREKGAAFFQGRSRKAGRGARGNSQGANTQPGPDPALGSGPAA